MLAESVECGKIVLIERCNIDKIKIQQDQEIKSRNYQSCQERDPDRALEGEVLSFDPQIPGSDPNIRNGEGSIR